MFVMSVLMIAAIGLPVGLAASLITHDLNRLVELTAVGTAISFLVVVWTWRWAMKKELAAQEAATPWLHVPSSVAGGIDAWRVLTGDTSAAAPPAEAREEPADAPAGVTPAPR